MLCYRMSVSHLFTEYSVVVVVTDRFFFHLGDKKVVAGRVRQAAILYGNSCMGICLGELSIGCLRRVVIL